MKLKVIFIALVLVLSGCSEQKKLRRAEKKIVRLTEKFPELLQKDTVTDTVIMFTPRIEADTVFVPTAGDTVTLTEDKLTVRFVQVGDTVYLEGECAADTIIQTVEIPIDRIVVREQTFEERAKGFLKAFWWLIILGVVILILIRVGWKFIKPF